MSRDLRDILGAATTGAAEYRKTVDVATGVVRNQQAECDIAPFRAFAGAVASVIKIDGGGFVGREYPFFSIDNGRAGQDDGQRLMMRTALPEGHEHYPRRGMDGQKVPLMIFIGATGETPGTVQVMAVGCDPARDVPPPAEMRQAEAMLSMSLEDAAAKLIEWVAYTVPEGMHGYLVRAVGELDTAIKARQSAIDAAPGGQPAARGGQLNRAP